MHSSVPIHTRPRPGLHRAAAQPGRSWSSLIGGAFVALFTFAPAGAGAADAALDRLLASQCTQCHGTNGAASGEMESLAGDEDLFEDLMDMLREDHAEDVMEVQAHGYRPDQIRRIADYYAGLPEVDADEDEWEDQE